VETGDPRTIHDDVTAFGIPPDGQLAFDQILFAATHDHQTEVGVSEGKRHLSHRKGTPKIEGDLHARLQNAPIKAAFSCAPGNERESPRSAMDDFRVDRTDSLALKNDFAGIA
jgi:hypothetical protein